MFFVYGGICVKSAKQQKEPKERTEFNLGKLLEKIKKEDKVLLVKTS